jgi:hypothetical protein
LANNEASQAEFCPAAHDQVTMWLDENDEDLIAPKLI